MSDPTPAQSALALVGVGAFVLAVGAAGLWAAVSLAGAGGASCFPIARLSAEPGPRIVSHAPRLPGKAPSPTEPLRYFALVTALLTRRRLPSRAKTRERDRLRQRERIDAQGTAYSPASDSGGH